MTYYDDATGERVELSAATLANWVAKTANLLQDELSAEPGDRLALLLPAHWQTAAWLLATAATGVVAALGGDPAEADLVVTGPDPLDEARACRGERVALSLRPLGARFAQPPAGFTDYAVAVPAQPDTFAAYDPPGPDHAALVADGEELTGREVVERARADAAERGLGPGAARNVLVIGTGEPAEDTDRAPRLTGLLLLHLPTDGRSATAVSVPPGLPADVPACAGRDGTPHRATRTGLDRAHATGGTACLIRTLERLTRLRLDGHTTTTSLAAAPAGTDVCAFHRSGAAPPELRAVPPGALRVLDVPAGDDTRAHGLLTRLRGELPDTGQPICAGERADKRPKKGE